MPKLYRCPYCGKALTHAASYAHAAYPLLFCKKKPK